MGKIKKFFKQFFLINDTPHKIAAGAALGIFLGIAPGEGVATTLILASLFKFNRLAATAGVLATNMWTTVLVLPLAGTVGGFLFGLNSSSLIQEFNRTFASGWRLFFSKVVFFDMALPLLVGFVAVAGLISLLFYFLVYFTVKSNRKNSKL